MLPRDSRAPSSALMETSQMHTALSGPVVDTQFCHLLGKPHHHPPQSRRRSGVPVISQGRLQTHGEVTASGASSWPSPSLTSEQAGLGPPSLPRGNLLACLHIGLADSIWGLASQEGLRLRGTAWKHSCLPRMPRSLDLPSLGLHGAAPPRPLHSRGVLRPSRWRRTLKLGVGIHPAHWGESSTLVTRAQTPPQGERRHWPQLVRTSTRAEKCISAPLLLQHLPWGIRRREFPRNTWGKEESSATKKQNLWNPPAITEM